MPFGLHESLGTPCAYLTLLRDPVERIESHYRWVLSHPESPHHAELASNRMNTREYVERHSAARFFNNGQTRLLGGTWADYRRTPTAATLRTAKRNLEGFSCVGMTRRFDESMLIMRQRLNWSWPFYERRNAAPVESFEPIDEETREAIARRNRLDIELWRWAEERFEAHVGRLGKEFVDELEVFRALNARPGREERMAAGRA